MTVSPLRCGPELAGPWLSLTGLDSGGRPNIRLFADIPLVRPDSALASGCFCGDLRSAGDTQLAHDVADVSLDGSRREIQPRGDLPVGHARRDQADDVHLAVSQAFPARGWPGRRRLTVAYDAGANPASCKNKTPACTTRLPAAPAVLMPLCQSVDGSGAESVDDEGV